VLVLIHRPTPDVDGVMRWWPLIIIAFGVVIIGSALIRRRR